MTNTDISAVEMWSTLDRKPILYKLGDSYFCCFNKIHMTRNLALIIMIRAITVYNNSRSITDSLIAEYIVASNSNKYLTPIDTSNQNTFLRDLILDFMDSTPLEVAANVKENMWDTYKHLMDNRNALIVA